MICRQRFVVIRSFSRRRSVHRSAGMEDVLEVRGLRDVFRALEHHVFEEMRKTGPTGLLVA